MLTAVIDDHQFQIGVPSNQSNIFLTEGFIATADEDERVAPVCPPEETVFLQEKGIP